MNDFYSFENLECWKQAKDLAVDLYKLSQEDELNRDMIMCDELRKTSLAIMNRIAEGKNRGNGQEFVRFLQSAKGSAASLQSNLIVSRDMGYLCEGAFLDFQDRANRVAALIGGLINAIKRQQEGQRLDAEQ
jgi:four helix bundle protein